ncbi:unnamed protein product [Phytomonas sp. Hart1]|nr:unnamed protein product [Phytomonas sp. Hart1]|eukprot:CCW67007.1 unnamed protein product [Phytomonas sp. isolate Hart1]
MGIPDFLKFAARSSPRALCRVPRSGTPSSTLRFDYILVDATNVDQTIGIDELIEFLKLPTITVRKAVIFALDSQRSREGTVRHHRQTHTMIGDLDVRVQRMCTVLTKHYQSQLQNESDEKRRGSTPLVLISGRNVAGEADYKILDLHRTITAAHLLAHERTLPSFLFISEDSDMLCGALCGPAPHTIGIATNLRSTTLDLCILRVEQVLEYIADCVETFKVENDSVPEKTDRGTLEQTANAQPIKKTGTKPQDTLLMYKDSEETAHDDDEDVPRRRKKDGPNIATGVQIKFSYSSSDDDDDVKGNALMATVLGSKITAPVPSREDETASIGDSRNDLFLSKYYKEAGYILETTCVDLVFLFVLIMGNGANVLPLGRGVTKVDIASCWQAYCQKKYLSMAAEEKVMGRTLLDFSSSVSGISVSSMKDSSNESQSLVSLSLDCGYLYSILRSVHYADDQSRSPVEEEKRAAQGFLSSVVYVTLRYLIGCNLEGGAMLTETFLDSRPLLETETTTPNLAAVLWVLGQQQRLSFQFLLGDSGLKNVNICAALDGHNSVKVVQTESKATNPSSSLQLDVREALVSPAPPSSWAVRGAGSRSYFLKVSTSNRNDPILFSSIPSEDGRGVSVASLVQQYATHCAETAATTDRKSKIHMSVFGSLITTWRRSVMIAIPHLQKLSNARNLTGGDSLSNHVGPTHSYTLSGVPSTNTSAATYEQAIHPTDTDNHAAEEDLVYSFELRRMVPILGSKLGHHNRLGNDIKGILSSLTDKQAALHSVLGISLDYTRQNLETPTLQSEPIHHRTTRNRDDKDHGERIRICKATKNEKNKGDPTAPRVKAPKAQRKSLPTSAAHSVNKSKMRPGRKERRKMAQQRQATNAEK